MEVGVRLGLLRLVDSGFHRLKSYGVETALSEDAVLVFPR